MCGICGRYNFNPEETVDASLIQKMCSVIKYRGPDDQGIYINKNIGLGHQRLSIIDLQSGHQPLSNEDKTVWIVFNGEIYNYRELRELLVKKGHTFQTNSDTEVIIHLYEERGEDFVSALRGMFALAIWDTKKKMIILTRDRPGKKPLYYLVNKNGLVFASELKSILQDEKVNREIDDEALDDFMSFLYVPAPKTIFKEIKKLLPGHILICKDGKIFIKEYWDIIFSPEKGKKENYYTERLLELLKEAVECRLMSEVPLGAFLSGGIDSSSIVALMSGSLKNLVITSSIGFKEEEFNELNYAEIVAKKYNTNHYEEIVTPSAIEVIDKLVWYFDEPFGDSSAIPTYYVSKAARKHITVALSGDGGDEIFAGYTSRYFYHTLENQIRGIFPSFLRRSIIPIIAKYYPELDWLPRPLKKIFRIKSILTNIVISPEESFFNTMSIYNKCLKDKLYTEEFKKKINGYDPFNLFEYYFNKTKGWEPLSRAQYVDIKTYLPNDILVKVDRMSMAVSLEVRAPFLDHKLIEFCATIPAHLKLQGMASKYILKKAMSDLLPDEILTRKKMGFGVPIGLWFRDEIKDMAEEILFSPSLQQKGYFNPEFIRQMWNQHQKGTRNFTYHLWALLIFEMWYQRFMEKTVASID